MKEITKGRNLGSTSSMSSRIIRHALLSHASPSCVSVDSSCISQCARNPECHTSIGYPDVRSLYALVDSLGEDKIRSRYHRHILCVAFWCGFPTESGL